MASPKLILALLFSVCLSCASLLEPWQQRWGGEQQRAGGVLDALIGDSRRLFANQVFAKADAYFHSGYYPSIFDSQKREEESHLAGGDEDHDDHAEPHDEKKEEGFLGPPKDWIDRFGRNFFPSQHTHLGEGGNEGEILPWLRLSAELEPQRVDTYTIASYWLRSRLGKAAEAEQFLREGLRANPESYEIYFELGRIYDENHHDAGRARTLWEIALRKWNEQRERAEAAGNPQWKPTDLVYEGITARLARLEEAQGNIAEAIRYLQLLKANSPEPEHIQKQIDELQARLTP